MAIAQSLSKDQPFRSKRRSLGQDDLLLSSAVNRATGVSPPDAAQRARRRRISQGGGWAKGRDRSQSRPRLIPPLPESVTKCLNLPRRVVRDYVWPVITWLFVLIPTLVSFLALLAVAGVIAESLHSAVHTAVCQKHPDAIPEWMSQLPWPLEGVEPCAYDGLSAVKVLLDDLTGADTLSRSAWPATQVQWLIKIDDRTQDQIDRAMREARVISSEALYENDSLVDSDLRRRSSEVAELISEWEERHALSHRLVREYIQSEYESRRDLLFMKSPVLRTIQKAQEARLHDTSALDMVSAWVPGVFPLTPIGDAIAELEILARSRASEAQRRSKQVPRFLKMLGEERETLDKLKVVLPINPRELGEDVDLAWLQQYLQHGFEQWTQAALNLLLRFQKEDNRMEEKYTRTSRALRHAPWNRKARLALIGTKNARLDVIRLSLLESMENLKADLDGKKPKTIEPTAYTSQGRDHGVLDSHNKHCNIHPLTTQNLQKSRILA